MLLKHLLKEKIEHATSGKSYQDNSANSEGNNGAKARSNSRPVGGVVKNISSIPSDKTQQEKTLAGAIGGGGTKDQNRKVSGSIKGETEKMLLIRFPGGKEMWVPKSTVDPGYDPGREQEQDFFVDEWILKKNKIET